MWTTEVENSSARMRGPSLAWRTDNVRGSSVTLYDPEGNEFCVA
jgi:hypothetical protein